MSKRLMDLALGGALLVLATPLLGLVAALVFLSMGPPVLFRQTRPGLHGRPFTIYKFRTMRAGRDEDGTVRPDHERLTWIGRLLRQTSLDELPELFNVLRGDMSLVGPRPLLMEYLPLYTAEQARRHEVRPGMTGLAQVEGRNALDWERRFELDVWYVDHRTLRLDLRILFRTARAVVRREGITEQGHVTMSRFRGTES